MSVESACIDCSAPIMVHDPSKPHQCRDCAHPPVDLNEVERRCQERDAHARAARAGGRTGVADAIDADTEMLRAVVAELRWKREANVALRDLVKRKWA